LGPYKIKNKKGRKKYEEKTKQAFAKRRDFGSKTQISELPKCRTT